MATEAQDAIRNVIIIGSGPAGYTAAVYTARANMKPLVIAGSVTAGGELMNTTDVENFPGFPEGIMGPDLMDNMQKQAERFGAEILFDDVTAVELAGDVKVVTLGDGTVYRAHAVILSTGSAYREIGLPDEKRLAGHGVSWCATCDGFFFRDQEIAVIGGGDSAMEEALFLTKFASKVTVVHRRDTLRASKIMADRALAHPKIEFIWDSEVVGITGEQKVTGMTLRNLKTDARQDVPVTGMFVAIGNDPRTDLVKDVLDLTAEGTIAVEGRTSKTSLPGVFAAGDVIDASYRQAITAAGSGCAAALDVEHYLADVEAAATANAVSVSN
ncbi:thioredoxin-disulfide reductase [Paeniglutamicibacter psychrophenolicus]|uniref:Thioredoxin reductase n=1 Tax=Paeniglutamicibacter psychrophenolicus TaxID=257454 RepID=A0ABS4W8S7_9MICC|nr:thioredoxin reductase (NADPH) [Paeniglutamicibacter psychrophenolicus]